MPPDRRFLRWCVEHPDELVWPAGAHFGEDTTVMRRALLSDEPPGREAAQRQASRHIESEPPAKAGWWRFEGTTSVDCLLATDKLVVTVEGKRTEPLPAATDWYPQRSQLVRNLEAARQMARGRHWGTLLISEVPVEDGAPDRLAASLDVAAPHLTEPERAELQTATSATSRGVKPVRRSAPTPPHCPTPFPAPEHSRDYGRALTRFVREPNQERIKWCPHPIPLSQRGTSLRCGKSYRSSSASCALPDSETTRCTRTLTEREGS